MKFLILFFILVGFLIVPDETEMPERRFFVTPSFEADTLFPHQEWIDFNDTIPGDTLRVYTNEEGLIHSYSREINTGVCIDGECRRLRMTLFWTVTGRYFGFILPKGEFLSKTEHVPFKDEDYHRLEEILINPYSVLKQYRIDELIAGEEEGVDGVTAATLATVKQETVPDAVYTTYTLWHMVYGETQKEIQKYTREHLTDELVLQLFKSTDFEDQLWTLENMGPKLQWTNDLRKAVLDKILHEQDILASQALSSFPDSILQSSDVQNILAQGFTGMAYINQRKVLERLRNIPDLDQKATLTLAEKLNNMSANIADGVLKLYEVHHVKNEAIDQMIVQLLDHENQFVVRKAVDYLETKDIQDKKVLRKIKKISLKRN